MQLQQPSPTLYFARYDQFESQLGPRRILPFSPLWLREALGVVELDMSLQHQGPVVRPDGKLELVSYIPLRRGIYQRVLVIAPNSGVIEETYIKDQTGRLVAAAQLAEHEFYPEISWSLPHRVQIQLYPDEGPDLAFTMDIDKYSINSSTVIQADAFVPPNSVGLTTVDLVQLNAGHANATQSPAYRTTEAQAIGFSRFR